MLLPIIICVCVQHPLFCLFPLLIDMWKYVSFPLAPQSVDKQCKHSGRPLSISAEGEGAGLWATCSQGSPPDWASGFSAPASRCLAGLLPRVARSALSADAPHLDFRVKFPAL